MASCLSFKQRSCHSTAIWPNRIITLIYSHLLDSALFTAPAEPIHFRHTYHQSATNAWPLIEDLAEMMAQVPQVIAHPPLEGDRRVVRVVADAADVGTGRGRDALDGVGEVQVREVPELDDLR